MRLGFAFSLLLIGCAADQQATAISDPITSTPIRVLTMNIANGAGAVWNTSAMRAAQAAFITAQSPDIVGLQEVDVGVARSGGGNTAAQAMGSLAATGTVITATCANVDANGIYTPGASGSVGVAAWVSNAFHVVDSWRVDLDYTAKSDGGDGWPRCSLLVSVLTPLGHPFVFAVSHLETGNRYLQNVTNDRAREVVETLADGPDIFLGDMNALGEEIKSDLQPQYHLCDSGLDSSTWVSPQYGDIDQVWSSAPCSGNLVPSHHTVTDHDYVSAGVVTL